MCLLHKHVQTLNYSNLGQDNPATVGSEDECGLSLDPVLNRSQHILSPRPTFEGNRANRRSSASEDMIPIFSDPVNVNARLLACVSHFEPSHALHTTACHTCHGHGFILL